MTPTTEALPRPQVKAAQEAVAEARQSRAVVFRDYGTVVRQVPMLLHRHGLGLTLAYLQMRGGGNRNSPFDLVTAQMDRWLLKAMGVTGRSFLGVMCGRDSRFYLEAFCQAELFARSLCACVEEPS